MMGEVHFNGPPPPRGDGRWCPICLMRAKARQYADAKPRMDAAKAGDPPLRVGWKPEYEAMLRVGEYRAVPGSVPELGIMDDLCWDDVAGITEGPERPLQQLAVPPGLLRGRR